MGDREVVGTDYSGRPVLAPTREELARPQPITGDELVFDEVQALDDGRLITETGYDDATGRHSWHEVDDRGNVLWDKPIDPEDLA